jgi:hypothetical protein
MIILATMLCFTGNWGLSPAYDVVPHPQHGGTLAMAMTREGDAISSEANVLKECQHFGYDREEARVDLQVMAQRIMDEYGQVLEETGLEEADVPDLAASFGLARAIAGEAGPGGSQMPSWEDGAALGQEATAERIQP